MKTLTLTLVVTLAALATPAVADAQQRTGGLALIGGGALMTLASGTCDIDRVSDQLTASLSPEGLITYSLSNPRATGGGPWPGAQCGFTVDYREQGNYTGTVYGSGTFTDAQLRMVPGASGDVDRLKADMRTRNPAMLYGGIAAIAGGAVLSLLPGGGDTPALDVRAGPQGIRLSRTFGF